MFFNTLLIRASIMKLYKLIGLKRLKSIDARKPCKCLTFGSCKISENDSKLAAYMSENNSFRGTAFSDVLTSQPWFCFCSKLDYQLYVIPMRAIQVLRTVLAIRRQVWSVSEVTLAPKTRNVWILHITPLGPGLWNVGVRVSLFRLIM